MHSTESVNQVTVGTSKRLFSPGDFTEDYKYYCKLMFKRGKRNKIKGIHSLLHTLAL